MDRDCNGVAIAVLFAYGIGLVVLAWRLSRYARPGADLGTQMFNADSFTPAGQRLFKVFRATALSAFLVVPFVFLFEGMVRCS